jgi:hypothetical protein
MDKPFIHEDARAEYVESYVWYHERGSHIAEAFEREVDRPKSSLVTPNKLYRGDQGQ